MEKPMYRSKIKWLYCVEVRKVIMMSFKFINYYLCIRLSFNKGSVFSKENEIIFDGIIVVNYVLAKNKKAIEQIQI